MKKNIRKVLSLLLCALLVFTLTTQVVFAEDAAKSKEETLSLGTSEEIALPAPAPRANTPPYLVDGGATTKIGEALIEDEAWLPMPFSVNLESYFADAENDPLTFFLVSNNGDGEVTFNNHFGYWYMEYMPSVLDSNKVIRLEFGANDGISNSKENIVYLITVRSPVEPEAAEGHLPPAKRVSLDHYGNLIWKRGVPEAEENTPEWDCAFLISILYEANGESDYLITDRMFDLKGTYHQENLSDFLNKSGTYTFELTAVDMYAGKPEEKYLPSEMATLQYEYTRPQKVISAPTDLKWVKEDGNYLWQFTKPQDVSGVYWYYVFALRNGTKGHAGAFTYDAKGGLIVPLLEGNEYTFTVRAITNDIERYANSELSETSPVLRPEKGIVDTKTELQNLSSQLESGSITATEALEVLNGLELSELKLAMQTDPTLLSVVAAIEEAYKTETGITATTTVSDYVKGRLQSGNISVVGAGLNSAGGTVELQFDKLKEEVTVDSIYMSYIQFSIELEGVEDSSDLAVPIRITMPLPNGLSPNRMVLMHYTNSQDYEEVAYVLNGDGTISFTVTHLSEFVFAEEYEGKVLYYDNSTYIQQIDSSLVTVLTGAETTLANGWYYVDKNLTYTTALNFSGEIHIIIADHCNLTFAGSFSSCQIYAQSTGSVGGKMALSSGTTGTISSGSGDIEIYPGATFTIAQGAEFLFYGGNFKNWGTFEVAGYLYNKPLSALWNHGSLTISGTLENDTNLFGVGNDTMTIKSGGKLINNFNFISLGAIDVEAGGYVENNHTTTITETGILTIKEGASFINNGTLESKGTIIGTVVNNKRPIIKPGMGAQTVALRPSSADGKIPAVVYAADLSRWFEDPDGDDLTYNLSDPGSGIIYSLENEILTLTASSTTPAGTYSMDVLGKDKQVYSEPVKVEIIVSAAPTNPAPGTTLHSLVVSTSDSTRGKVTGNSNGSYVAGATITVAAVPYDSRPFTGWTVSGVQVTTTDNPLSFIMPAGEVTLTASFGELYPVTMISGAQAGGGWYPEGGIVPIVAATPSSGQRFKQWETTPAVTFTAGTRKTSPSAKFIMPTEEVKVSATFEDIPPTTYSVNVPNGTGSGNYAEGATVTLTANAPASGQRYKQWNISPAVTFTEGTTATTSTAKFAMPAEAVTATAVYEIIPAVNYLLTVTNGTGGGSFPQNATVTITANAPASGQRFKNWTVSPAVTFTGGTSATSATAKFTMSAGAVTATAVYEPIPPTTYPVTVANGTGGGNYAEGATVTITANNPQSGQRFKQWNITPAVTFTGGTTAATSTAKFAMPAETVTATAVYEPITSTTTPEATPNVKIDYINERLTNLIAGADYTVNGTTKTSVGGVLPIDTTWLGQSVSIVKTGNGTTTTNSAAQSLIIPSRPAMPTGIVGVNTSAIAVSDGKITGVTNRMEYKESSEIAWIACTGMQISGLATGNYQVRLKAIPTAFCSTAINVVVGTGSQQTRLLTLTAPLFDKAVVGYSRPGAKSVVIANSGNATATISSVTISGSDFLVSGSGNSVPSGGSINTWTVQPNAGLSVGTYNATITVGYDSGEVATAAVSFTVISKTQIAAYTVTFNLAGGTHTGGGALTQTVLTGGAAIAPTVTRSGYSFTGWDKDFSTITANITVTAQWKYSGESTGNSGSSSGGGGGGSSSGRGVSSGNKSGNVTTTKPATTWLDKASAAKLVNSANAGGKAYVSTKAIGTYGVRGNVMAALTGLSYQHDTVLNNAVQLRVYLNNPTKFTKDTLVSGYTKGTSVDKTRATFSKWFSNKLVVIQLDQQEDWEAPVKIAAKVDLSTIDTKNLYFYSYNAKLNNYRRIEKPEYWIDADGYLHFTTPFAGSIIVSEGQLKKSRL